MTIQTHSAEETQKFGEEFAEKIKDGGVVCLYGNLGAGKTTLVQGMAKGLGIKDSVISPTYILVRRYELPAVSSKLKAVRYLWHIDLYRLNDVAEIKGLGFEDIIGRVGDIILIEWPEKIVSELPRQRWEIHLDPVSENERKITIAEIK